MEPVHHRTKEMIGMSLPVIIGLPLPILGGILLFVLIVFQILVGMKIVKLSITWHKWIAFAILLLAVLHAVGALGIWFGWISIG